MRLRKTERLLKSIIRESLSDKQISFLKHNRCLLRFIYLIYKNHRLVEEYIDPNSEKITKFIEHMLQLFSQKSYINNSFIWVYSKEGFHYWNEIYKKSLEDE